MKPSQGSCPTHTATDSPPSTGLRVGSPSVSGENGHGMNFIRGATTELESSASSPYETPCEYQQRPTHCVNILTEEVFNLSNLPTSVPHKTGSLSENASSTAHHMNNYGTILPKANSRDRTDLQSAPASCLSTVRRTPRKQRHARCSLPAKLTTHETPTYVPPTHPSRRPYPTSQTSKTKPPSDSSRGPSSLTPNPIFCSQLLRTQSPNQIPRRPSAAAPGIAAPSATTPLEPRNTLPRKPERHRKMVNYPPELQYPRPPALPVRQTPAWTRLDTQTPPPRTGVREDEEKKRRGRGLCGLCSA